MNAAHLTATIRVLTPYEGNARWFMAVSRGLSSVVKEYDCEPVEEGGAAPSRKAIAQVEARHPGMVLVYLD